ncbi:MAG: LLM class F420-dependent oxidoreductase [bacterium]|nr:LLM class F420-dependent oxidoreductase [bacterium]
MKFGIGFANILHWSTAQGAVGFGQAAEAAGFDSVWTVEHVVYPDSYASVYPYDPAGRMPMTSDTPLPDPLIWLTWVATATATLRLGTGILILPQRNPLVLAKTLGTLDSMSGGRVSLGVGVGWLKEEFEALGIPWERRGQRTDDYIGAMRALWDADSASFDSEHASFSGVSVNPKPANGRVPIVIGGHSRAAARRAGRLGDGFWPGPKEGSSMVGLIDEMRQTAAAAGRDPDGIEITLGLPNTPMDDPVGLVQEVADLGADRLIVPSFLFLEDTAETMAGFGAQLHAAAG